MRLVHRILTPIIAVLSIPAAIFLPLFRIYIASGLSAQEVKPNLLDTFGLSEFISLFDIYDLYKNGSGESFSLYKSIWDAFTGEKKQEIIDMLPGLHWGIVALVLFVIALIAAIVLAIVSAATKKYSASLIISLVGIASTFFMNTAFNGFARPFLNGAFNLNSILGNTNQLLGILFGSVASFEYMKLGIAYSALLLIFLCVAILSLCAVMEQKNEDK